MTVPEESGEPNSVPAGAVKQNLQALPGFTGRKASVGGLASLRLNTKGLTFGLLRILLN